MVEYLAACIIAQLEGLMYHQTIYWKYMHVQQFNTDGVIISIIKKKDFFSQILVMKLISDFILNKFLHTFRLQLYLNPMG